jgi:hypothetical protein
MSTPDFPLRPEPRLTVKVEAYTPRRSGALICFCTVIVPEMRLRVIDVTVFQSHGKRWCGLPGKPQIDKDGQARRDDRGKVVYSPVIQFTDRDVGDAFSDLVIEALLEAHPRAFKAVERME